MYRSFCYWYILQLRTWIWNCWTQSHVVLADLDFDLNSKLVDLDFTCTWLLLDLVQI